MLYMFDQKEIKCCTDCELMLCEGGAHCVLDDTDVVCTTTGEGLPITCPLMLVTKERVEAYNGRL
jgi:hypothetical protein